MHWRKLIIRILKSKVAFWLYSLALILGAISFMYTSFKSDVERQDKLLSEIKYSQELSSENNQRLQELEKSNEELKIANEKLVKTVCILQEQIESLGGTPAVERNSDCANMKL